MYIFGDGVSTTTNYGPSSIYYYGNRNSNGRVWVEVLAQRLGLGANSITNTTWSNSPNNWSYYGQYSYNLVTNINNCWPTDASTAVFVVWVNDADFVNDIATFSTSQNQGAWNNAMNQSLANHWSIINSLYQMGARSIVMPNAVDLTAIPEFDGIWIHNPGDGAFIRQQVINFNTQFAALLNQAQSTFPGLKIYEPDFFSLLNNVVANPSAYGLTNALCNGVSVDALSDPNLSNVALNGPGANYIFWDPTDPSAKFHEIMADTVQQMIAPVQIGHLAVLSPNSAPVITNQLTVVNVPVGLSGFVDGCTNSGQAQAYWTWTAVTNFSGASATQSVSVYAAPLPPFILPSGTGSIYPGAPQQNQSVGTTTQTNTPGILQYYRLRFPFSWQWP